MDKDEKRGKEHTPEGQDLCYGVVACQFVPPGPVDIFLLVRGIFCVDADSETLSSLQPVRMRIPATLTLFGFPTSEAQIELLVRSRSWRLTRALGFGIGGVILAPLVGLVPPHAPWALIALAAGGTLALRRWKERYTLVSLSSHCPKCGGAVSIPKPTPLKASMTVPCPGCHHDARLVVDLPHAAPPTHESQ